MSELVKSHLRVNHMPHILCPGCGHGIIMGAVIRALDRLEIDPDKTMIVSGIGCSSRVPGYMDYNTLHTTHGRALAFATGIKLARPELKVIVLAGDGDIAAIGGNHLIHAARRNIGISTVVFNNSIYGMTSGQYSPLTPKAALATTAPYGNVDRSFDLCHLAQGAGATYVARSTTYHIHLLIDLLTKAFSKNGFSFVEVFSQCPTYYGRRNRIGSAVDMMKDYKERAITVEAARKLSPAELEGKIVIGEFLDIELPEYTAEYQRVVERAMAKKAGRS